MEADHHLRRIYLDYLKSLAKSRPDLVQIGRDGVVVSAVVAGTAIEIGSDGIVVFHEDVSSILTWEYLMSRADRPSMLTLLRAATSPHMIDVGEVGCVNGDWRRLRVSMLFYRLIWEAILQNRSAK